VPNPTQRERERDREESERHYIRVGVKEIIFLVLKVPRQCPLLLFIGVKLMIMINSEFNFYAVRKAALERIFFRKYGGCSMAKLFMLPMGGLHVRHAVHQ
jgi:hypothetical protein